MTNFQTLLNAFQTIGATSEVHEERHNEWHKDAVPTEATQFISTGIAHYHFDKSGKYLGTECNGDGTFMAASRPSEAQESTHTV